MESKKYQLYAVGNAVVDIVVQASDDFLKTHKVSRGLMTLTDYEPQQRLISEFPLSRQFKQSGGSAANTAVAFAQLGGSCFYSCLVGDDELGNFYLRDLQEAGVHTVPEKLLNREGKTATCLVMVSHDGERSMHTHLGVTADFSPSVLQKELLLSSEWVYMEGYLMTGEHGLQTLQQIQSMALEHRFKTALSLSDPLVVRNERDKFRSLLEKGVDFLFCNEEEARMFSGSDQVEDICKCLEEGAKQYAITLGKRGAFLYDGHDYHHIPAKFVQVIDTNGAGDMFAAGFLYGIIQGYTFLEAGEIAIQASSKIVSKLGPRLDARHVKELKARGLDLMQDT